MADDSVPSWVPELSPGIHADVYPVSPPQTPAPIPTPAELRLDRHTVTHGYAERRLPYEFSSVLPPDRPTPSLTSAPPGADPTPNTLTPADLHKLRAGLATLRRTRPTKLQRVELTPPALSGKPFPLQKPSASSSLEDWFNRLSTSTPLSDLSRSVPLGPAIVRAAGKVIEMLATRNVPTQRAAWYIRIAVLNECIKQVRPDRPPPSPRAFWTRQLCTLLKADVDAIRARKTAILGSMDRVAFWRYVLDLARWQADEALLDLPPWLSRITTILRTELLASQSYAAPATKISLLAARRFLPEFLSSVETATQLCDALLPGASAVVKAWRAAVTKPAKGRKPGKRFAPNQCHAEIFVLLAAALRAIHADITVTSEMRLPDLERLVKRGVDAVHAADRRKKPDAPEIPRSPHLVLRELERLPVHGDLARVVAAAQGTGDVRSGVRSVCEWALDGPVSDHPEAACIAAAVLTALSDACRASPAVKKRMRKAVHQPRGATAETPPLQRELWTFFKAFSEGHELEELDKEDHVVRFIATLCRLDLLSLPAFVRDVSRLASCAHPGAVYLVKCLSLLPDPVDKSISDCRRALLRKYGYVSAARSNLPRGVEEKAYEAACSGDMTAMETEAEKLVSARKTKVILSTAEAVRLEDLHALSESNADIQARLFTMASFFLYAGEPGLAVEWLLDNMGDLVESAGAWTGEANSSRRETVLLTMIRLSEHLARYFAACGHLESVFTVMKRTWLSTWISAPLRAQILATQASFCRLLGASSGGGSIYWTKMVAKNLRQHSEGSKSAGLTPFAIASMRGREDRLPAEQSLTDILNINTKENLGLSADDDLADLRSRGKMYTLDVPQLRKAFLNADDEFPVESYFAKGFTANDILGGVLIPVLTDALTRPEDENALDGLFARLAVSALQLIGGRQHDVRLQGVRPGVLLEFIALLIAGCVCGHTEASESLEVLVGMKWVWKILAPSAGIGLAKRLRKRSELNCDRVVQSDKALLSALLFNMVCRISGDVSRDEDAVANALGTEPFGIIEMQLALLAAHRQESGEELEFGTRIGHSATAMACGDRARTLVSSTLRCCVSEESKHVVSGIVGYNAAQAMVESLEYVVTGLTVEAPENSDVHVERAEQWYQADTARRATLECATECLSQEVGVQVESVLFEQLVSATEQLSTAQSQGCMLSNILEEGQRISEALESRLNCILRSPRTPQAADIWRQRALQMASLLKTAVPLMNRSAILSISSVLNLCLRSLADSGKADDPSAAIPLNHVLDKPNNRELKKELDACLAPVLLWIESPERDILAKLVPRSVTNGPRKALPLKVCKADGTDVDNWVLLEGYGRGSDEEPAIPPTAFWRQAEGASHGEEVAPVVHLKRTYSTFASLAV